MDDNEDTGETVAVDREALRETLFHLLYKSSPAMTWDGYMGGMDLLLSVDPATAIDALGWLYAEPDGAKEVEYVAQEFGLDLAEVPNHGLCAGGCGDNVYAIGEDAYMVRDEVWQAAGDPEGQWCIGCLEARLGRDLVAADFDGSVPYTTDDGYWRSDRLCTRLGIA